MQQVRIEMREASTYAYSNKNCIVYLYILIFTINTASSKLSCDVGHPKADPLDGDVRTVMYTNQGSFIMGPKTAQTLTRGLNFQSIVTAIYVSYACEQFDKYNFRLLSKFPYLLAATGPPIATRPGSVFPLNTRAART